MACSKLVNLENKFKYFLSFFKLTKRKIFDYKEIFFLFYVTKSISFKVKSFKNKHFCGQIDTYDLNCNF